MLLNLKDKNQRPILIRGINLNSQDELFKKTNSKIAYQQFIQREQAKCTGLFTPTNPYLPVQNRLKS